MTAADTEALAATHSDGCPPICPACLSSDLKAKAQAVRETCARMVELEAEHAYLEREYGWTKVLRRLALQMRAAK